MGERKTDVAFSDDLEGRKVVVGHAGLREHTVGFVDGRWQVLDVLEDLVAQDEIEEAVVERKAAVGRDRLNDAPSNELLRSWAAEACSCVERLHSVTIMSSRLIRSTSSPFPQPKSSTRSRLPRACLRTRWTKYR